MQSLNAVRLASRVLSRTFTNQICVKPTPFIRNSLLATRMISTTKFSFGSINDELVEALKHEINAEKQLEKSSLGGESAPNIPGFEISTNDAEVRLSKVHGKEKILVVVNVNHSVDIDETYEGDAAEPAVPMALPPFSIEITKGNERLCFHLELVQASEESGDFDFRVEEFYIAPATADEDVPASVYASSGKYIDPNLHELLFDRFLQERGFDAKFCSDLVNFATHYEHSQYVSLLERIKTFIKK